MKQEDIPLPVNDIDRSLPIQLIFITEEKYIDYLMDRGYEVNYTFAGKIYFVADEAMRFQKGFKDTRKRMVQKAHKIIDNMEEGDGTD